MWVQNNPPSPHRRWIFYSQFPKRPTGSITSEFDVLNSCIVRGSAYTEGVSLLLRRGLNDPLPPKVDLLFTISQASDWKHTFWIKWPHCSRAYIEGVSRNTQVLRKGINDPHAPLTEGWYYSQFPKRPKALLVVTVVATEVRVRTSTSVSTRGVRTAAV